MQTISRQDFDALDKHLLRSKREGSGPMAANCEDCYLLADGRIVLHDWAMGGETFTVVHGAAAIDELKSAQLELSRRLNTGQYFDLDVRDSMLEKLARVVKRLKALGQDA